MTHFTKYLLLAAVVGLSGCGSLSNALANRVSCTAGGDQAIVSSMYGPIGVASIVDDRDAAVLCKNAPQ